MNGGAPSGAEAVGDLSEHDGGPDLALAGIVGGGHLAIGQEQEELAAPALDLLLQDKAGWVDGRGAQQHVELSLGLGRVVGQGAVGQGFPPLADADRPAQEIADLRSEPLVAAVDGVLDVAQDMGQADLMLAGQILLSSVLQFSLKVGFENSLIGIPFGSFRQG